MVLKPCKRWDKLTTSTGLDFFHQHPQEDSVFEISSASEKRLPSQRERLLWRHQLLMAWRSLLWRHHTCHQKWLFWEAIVSVRWFSMWCRRFKNRCKQCPWTVQRDSESCNVCVPTIIHHQSHVPRPARVVTAYFNGWRDLIAQPFISLAVNGLRRARHSFEGEALQGLEERIESRIAKVWGRVVECPLGETGDPLIQYGKSISGRSISWQQPRLKILIGRRDLLTRIQS